LTQLWRLTLRPHGALHLGAARLLLLGWRMAREAGARVKLFIDDTEAPAPEVVAGAERDLAWLGLEWDATIRASSIATDEAVAALKQSGRLYPCWEPEAELAAGGGGGPPPRGGAGASAAGRIRPMTAPCSNCPTNAARN
jgi:glutamyl/glutaminyl-tRNA synthetase